MEIEPRQAQPIVAAALQYFGSDPARLAQLEDYRDTTIPRDKISLGDPAQWMIKAVTANEQDATAATVEFDPGASGGRERRIFAECQKTPGGWAVVATEYRIRPHRSDLERFQAGEN